MMPPKGLGEPKEKEREKPKEKQRVSFPAPLGGDLEEGIAVEALPAGSEEEVGLLDGG